MKTQVYFICFLASIIFTSAFYGTRWDEQRENARTHFRIPTSSSEASKEYTIGKKKIKITYPSSHKDWKNNLQGAYCRNEAVNLLKNDKEVVARVSKVRCRYLQASEIESFDFTKSFDEGNKELTLPFTVSKSGSMSLFKNKEVIDFLVSDKWQWKELQSEVLGHVKIKVHSMVTNMECVNLLLPELEDAFYESMQSPINLRSKLELISFEEISSTSKEVATATYNASTKAFNIKIKNSEHECKPDFFDDYKNLVFSSDFKIRKSKTVLDLAMESLWRDHTVETFAKKLLSYSNFKNTMLKDFIKKVVVTADFHRTSSLAYSIKDKELKLHFQYPLNLKASEELIKALNMLADKIIEDNSLPKPIWNGKHNNSTLWTQYALEAIDRYPETFLSDSLVIKDAKNFCPNYHSFTRQQKRDFWLYFTSVLVRYESNFNPNTRYVEKGKIRGVVSLGLLSMSYKSAKHNYDCDPASAKESDLKKEKWNLQCGIKIVHFWLKEDAAFNNGGSSGVATYYGPLRSGRKELAGIKSYLRQAKACGLE